MTSHAQSRRAERLGAVRLFREAGAGRSLFGVYLLCVLLLITFVAPFIRYACKHSDIALMNPLYLALAVLVGIGFLCLVCRVRSAGWAQRLATPKAFYAVLVASCLALLALQAFVVRGAWFETGWDVANLSDPVASSRTYYFSTYPNQLFLAGLFSHIMSAGACIGLGNGYLCLVAVSCVCVTASLLLVALVARRLGGYAAAYAFLVVAFVFIGVSPWILVPYSDTYGMLWTSLCLWVFVCCKRRTKWPAFAACALIGYSIKPTVVFVAVAVVVVKLYAVFRTCRANRRAVDRRQHSVPSIVATSAMTVAALIAALVVVQSLSLSVDDLDKEKGFSSTHFLMMGFNPERQGIWAADDVDLSRSAATPAERRAINLRTWAQRVESMGLLGTAKLLAKKTCTNYADGSFAWEAEGDFYHELNGSNDFLCRIYGIGQYPNLFEPIYQVIWLAVLVGAAISCFARVQNKSAVSMMCLTLLFLSIFLTLFECRARYLFLYSPYFVLLGTLGWLSLKPSAKPSLR